MLKYQSVELTDSPPLTLAQVKAYLKVDVSSDDEVIQTIISSVTDFAVRHTGRTVQNGSWLALADSFDECFVIHRRRVESIDSVAYINNDGDVILVSSDVYELGGSETYPEMQLTFGSAWPTDISSQANAVAIQFTTSPDVRLPQLKLAMLKHIAHEYEQRGDDASRNDYKVIDFYNSVSVPNF